MRVVPQLLTTVVFGSHPAGGGGDWGLWVGGGVSADGEGDFGFYGDFDGVGAGKGAKEQRINLAELEHRREGDTRPKRVA
jgi:hypothetical protein